MTDGEGGEEDNEEDDDVPGAAATAEIAKMRIREIKLGGPIFSKLSQYCCLIAYMSLSCPDILPILLIEEV